MKVQILFDRVKMGNHFHFLVRIKTEQQVLDLEGFSNLQGLKNSDRVNQQFANLFNAYKKA